MTDQGKSRLPALPAPWFFLAMAFSIPLSVKLFHPGSGLVVIMPGELLAGVAALLFLIWIGVRHRTGLGALFGAWHHPIVMIVLLDLVLQVVSGFTSSMPLVTWKAVCVQGVFLLAFFLPWTSTSDGAKWVRELLNWFAVAMLLVVAWTLAQAWNGDLDRRSMGYASMPFFQDRTIYSASLTFTFFIWTINTIRAFRQRRTGTFLLHATLALVSLIAVVLSYTRAAWLALLAGGLFIVLFLLRPSREQTLRGVALLMLLAAVGWSPLSDIITRNKADADADGATMAQQLASVLNTRSDWSNRERLNRWYCAWRMFLDEPVLGHGQGTYQFIYPEYQRPGDKTYLSMDAPPPPEYYKPFSAVPGGPMIPDNPQPLIPSGGTAHSEFLLRTSERGLLGILPFLALFVAVLLYTARAGRRTSKSGSYMELVILAVSIFTYGVHGLFNNYLDDPKVSFPFWATVALFTLVERGERALRGTGAGPAVEQ